MPLTETYLAHQLWVAYLIIKACDQVSRSGESDIRGLPWDKIDAWITEFETGKS